MHECATTPHGVPRALHRVQVSGGCVIAPKTMSPAGFLAIDFDYAALLGPERGRRLDPLSQLALLAVDGARENARLGASSDSSIADAEGVTVGSALGATTTSVRYARRLVRAGAAATNPIDFPDSIDGAPAAHVALDRRLGGPSLTFADGEASASSALVYAARQIACGRATRMYVVVGDKVDPWLADELARDPEFGGTGDARDAIPAECILGLVLERLGVNPRFEAAIELVGYEGENAKNAPRADSASELWSEPYRWYASLEGTLRLGIGASAKERQVVDPSGAMSLAGAWIRAAGTQASVFGLGAQTSGWLELGGAVEPAGKSPIAERVRCGMPRVPLLGFVRAQR